MQWGPQQAQALNALGAWLADGRQQVFRLHGFAGTGKTTLARHVADTAGGDVAFVAPTGKAADVLRRKGCAGASTIHSAIYRVSKGGDARLLELKEERARVAVRYASAQAGAPESTQLRVRLGELDAAVTEEERNLGRLRFVLNEDSDIRHASLVICDESSMVGDQVAQDLLSFGVPVLALGDPFQLPPVRSSGSPLAHEGHDFLLTDVHRQAKDSPVIALATMVRQESRLPVGQYGSSRVSGWYKPSGEEVQSFDQLLVGTNKLRVGVNRRYRELLGRTGDPAPGDRLVCLKNNRTLGLFNGQQWVVERADPEMGGVRGMALQPLVAGDGQRVEVSAVEEAFWSEKPPQYVDSDCAAFTFAYGMTVHKAQGSEWPSVFVFGDWPGRDYWRWMYTAITRAQERVQVLVA